MKKCVQLVLYAAAPCFSFCLSSLGQVSPSLEAAYLALEAAQRAEEAVLSPSELPVAIRVAQRAQEAARIADETALELDLGLLGDDLRRYPTLIRRQAKLVEIDAQRIMDEFDL